ncbi:hypothetical protein ABW19_dt0201815 [Dactylella cylindrospora]|nr:hypothetical protein ABW19_dt0201815 [Dactylella cylindrospora]
MRSKLLNSTLLLALSLLPASISALTIDVEEPDTIRAAAKVVIENLANEYRSQDPLTPGILGGYSYFQSAIFFNTLIDYAAWSGDDQFNDLIRGDFFGQIGDDGNFLPSSQPDAANDDVGLWALAAMTAAEYGVEPLDSNSPSYLTLADNVFNDFVNRWDDDTCRGGLRWTISPTSSGYDFKDTTSNGAFFQLAARLGLHTKNETYLEWATTVFDWSVKTGVIQDEGAVYSGASVQDSCKQIDKKTFTSNLGLYFYGSAAMANATGAKTWEDRALGTYPYSVANFFGPQLYVDDGTSQVIYEPACSQSTVDECNTDQKAGRSIFLRAFGAALDFFGETYEGSVLVPLSNSARGAARSCSSSGDCSFSWTNGEYDASKGSGAPEKMAAIEAFLAVLRFTNATESVSVFDSAPAADTTTAAPSGASQTNEAPAATTTDAPGAGAKMAVGGFLGAAVVVASFLQMVL